MSTPMVYVLLSGGLDSTTALALARRDYKAHDVRAVSVDYGQRHRVELARAARIAEMYEVQHTVLRVPMPRSMLTDPSIEVPAISYSEIKGVSPTYVPFRNGLMLSTLTSHIAGSRLDPTQKEAAGGDYYRDCLIYWGAHAEDAAGGAYPDCTVEFIGAMACAISIGTYGKIRMIAPFATISKAEIVALGSALTGWRTAAATSWSCYRGGDVHCGVCATCQARKAAFVLAGIEDCTVYADRPTRPLV